MIPQDFDALTKKIEECFLEEPGPGILPESRDNDDAIAGILAPYGDYSKAGFSMSWAYKTIAETRFKDTFIIIGCRKGNSTLIDRDIETPLGVVRTDQDMVMALKRLTRIASKGNEEIDTSITLQLPFLQYASRDRLSNLKVVCLEIGDNIAEEQLQVLAEAMRMILKEQKKDCSVICSTNLTEYGEGFGYKPFIYNVKESIENIDYHIIDSIGKKDHKDIIRFVEKEKANVRGYKSIALLMMLLKDYDSKLLQYYRSDLMDKENKDTTSYLSMYFL